MGSKCIKMDLFMNTFQVGNLGLLFMLLFFIYAALGVELFGELGPEPGALLHIEETTNTNKYTNVNISEAHLT